MIEIDDIVARSNASIDRASKEKLQHEFQNLNLKLISKKSKKDLIDWLTKYPIDSPQYVWGQQELSKKLLQLQLKIAIGVAIFSAIVAISLAL